MPPESTTGSSLDAVDAPTRGADRVGASAAAGQPDGEPDRGPGRRRAAAGGTTPPDRRRMIAGIVAAVVVLVGGALVVGTQRSDDGGGTATLAESTPSASSAPEPTGSDAATDPATEGATPAGPPPPAQIAGTPTSQTVIAVPTQMTLPNGALVPVDPAGVDDAGALSVPADPGRAGWWTGGAQVGEPFGTVVIAGHIDSRAYGIGQMAELRNVVAGDLVVVGNGTVSQTFRVETSQQIAKADLSADSELFDQTGAHRLVLITCDGVFDASTHRYSDNLVVTAVPVA